MNKAAREASQKQGCPVEAYSEASASKHGYQAFGWEGTICDRAIRADNVEAVQWIIDQGIIDKDTKTFYDTPIRRLCAERAPKCEQLLAKLGYPA